MSGSVFTLNKNINVKSHPHFKTHFAKSTTNIVRNAKCISYLLNIWDYVLQNKMQYLKYISLYGNHVCFLIYEVMIPNVNLITFLSIYLI